MRRLARNLVRRAKDRVCEEQTQDLIQLLAAMTGIAETAQANCDQMHNVVDAATRVMSYLNALKPDGKNVITLQVHDDHQMTQMLVDALQQLHSAIKGQPMPAPFKPEGTIH